MFLPRGASAGGQDIPKVLKLEMQRETPHKLLSKVPPCYWSRWKRSLQFRQGTFWEGRCSLAHCCASLSFFDFPIFTVYYYRKGTVVDFTWPVSWATPSSKAVLGCTQDPEEDESLWACFMLYSFRIQGHWCWEPPVCFCDQNNLTWVKNIILSCSTFILLKRYHFRLWAVLLPLGYCSPAWHIQKPFDFISDLPGFAGFFWGRVTPFQNTPTLAQMLDALLQTNTVFTKSRKWDQSIARICFSLCSVSMVYAHIWTDPRSIPQEQLPSVLRRWSKWFTEPFSYCKSTILEPCLEVLSCYLWKCECKRKKRLWGCKEKRWRSGGFPSSVLNSSLLPQEMSSSQQLHSNETVLIGKTSVIFFLYRQQALLYSQSVRSKIVTTN